MAKPAAASAPAQKKVDAPVTTTGVGGQQRQDMPRMDSLSGWQHAVGNQHLLSLINSNRMQLKSRSALADPLETEADRASDLVTQRIHKPQIQSNCAGGDACHCAKCSLGSQQSRVVQLSSASSQVQRQTKEDSSAGEAAAQEAAGARKPAGGFLVEDDATSLSKGQMHRSVFLAQVQDLVCTTANAELVGTGRTADQCPYISKWMARYKEESAAHIERALWRYAPEAAHASSAKDYFAVIRRRVRNAVATWAKTGKITGVPEGVADSVGGASASGATQEKGKASEEKEGFGTNLLRTLTGQKKVQFKEQPGTSGGPADPETVRGQLGSGKGMDSRSRIRMESAFGQDFSRVRIHTDSRAEGLSSQLNARAFTVGSDIAFASGEYRPGTLLGDALLAHELAHVVQQGAAVPSGKERSSQSSGQQGIEGEANRAAAGVIAGQSGLKRIASSFNATSIAPRMREGLSLRRCSHKLEAKEVNVDLSISEGDESLMEQLEGLEDPVYQDYRDVEKVQQAATVSKALTSPAPSDDTGGMGAPHIDIDIGPSLVSAMQDRVEKDLAKEGRPQTYFEFRQKILRFQDFFEKYAMNLGFQILEQNEKLVEGEKKHYSGDPAKGGVAAIRAALQPFKDKISSANYKRLLAGGAGGIMVPNPDKLLEEAKALDDPVRRALAPVFPIVSDRDLNLHTVLYSDNARAQDALTSRADTVIDNIQETRGRLKNSPSKVWKFDMAVARAQRDLNIQPGSIFAMIIEDKIHGDVIDEVFSNLLIAALAIGLGALSAGTGAVAVLGAVAGAGLSAGVAVSHIDEFRAQSAAHGTAFDQAEAISSQDPSAFWLALDIVFAVADAGAAVKAFRALRPLAAEVKTIEDAEKLRAPALAALETTPAKQGEKVEAAASATAAVAKKEEQVEKIVAGAKKHVEDQQLIASAEKADAATVQSLRAAVTDEKAVAGLLQIESGARGKLLEAFKSQPAMLRRLGQLVEESKQVARTVENLSKKLTPAQFKAVLAKYMRTRSTNAPNILRAIADANLVDKDFEEIAAALARRETADTIGKEFATQAIEKIANRLPPGKEGIEALRKATAGLHPAQSGSIFEKWAAKNIFKRDPQRFYADTKALVEEFEKANPGKVKPKFEKTNIVSDDMRPLEGAKSNEAAVIDYKHYPEGQGLDKNSITQLNDYDKLTRLGVKNKDGRVISEVQYIFSSEKAAAKNKGTIKAILGDRGSVFFIDDAGNLTKL